MCRNSERSLKLGARAHTKEGRNTRNKSKALSTVEGRSKFFTCVHGAHRKKSGVHLSNTCCWYRHDSATSMMTTLRDGRYSFKIPAGAVVYFFSKKVQTGCGAHPAPNSMGTELFSRAKKSGRVTDHSPPSYAKVKNEWTYASTLFLGRRVTYKNNLILKAAIRTKQVYRSLYLGSKLTYIWKERKFSFPRSR